MHPRRSMPMQLVLCLLALFASADAASKAANAVKLENIKTLTFHKDRQTTARRVEAIPQLSCVGGSGCNLYTPDTIRCTNSGSSYSSADIEWTCTASLPPEFKLGSTDVYCEGYNSPEDEYILKGSCGVEYRLVLTELGEQKYKNRPVHAPRAEGRKSYEDGRASYEVYIFCFLFIAVAGFILYSIFFSQSRSGRTTRSGGRRSGGGGGGGGGRNGYDDPPPPYSPQPKAEPSTYRTGRTRAQPSTWTNTTGTQNGQQGWRPGFWTGAAAGVAADEAFRGVRNAMGGGRTQQTWREPEPEPQVQQRSSWWGGGSSQAASSSSGRRYQGSGGSSGVGSGASYSASSYTSTGFGGTKRR